MGLTVHLCGQVCGSYLKFHLNKLFSNQRFLIDFEGIFRMACENVLKTMKKGRETLLTLLEAFVYDPLVDWTLGIEGLVGTIFGGVPGSSSNRQTRKDLEREVTLAMFNVRCAEMKIEWNNNKDDIVKELPALIELYNKWLHECKKHVDVEDILQDLHQQMALVKEAEANGINKHPLHSLPGRYDAYRKTQDSINNAKKDLDNIVADCDTKSQRYGEALTILDGQQFTQWSMELNANFEVESIRIFDLVKEFLQNAGQSSMILQCVQYEEDVGQLVQQQIVHTVKCLQLLQEYGLIINQCPASFLQNHRAYIYPKWCKYLQETKTLSACDEIFQKFCQFVESYKYDDVKLAIKFSYQLHVLYSDVANQLTKVYEDLNAFQLDKTIITLHRIYNDAKTSIGNFLGHERGASNAFEFVIVSELLLLNQTFLTLETAASRRGDWLLKLNSRDGIWFLDDLTHNSNKAMELISYLHLKPNYQIEDHKLGHILNCLKSANNMYKSLQELNYNFHTIILPESMKKIQSDDVTVIGIINELNSLIVNLDMPLGDVIQHLEKDLNSIVMEMDVNSAGDVISEKVKDLKIKYETLLLSQSQVLSSGKMLLMGFNGLFEKLNSEYNNLISNFGTLNIPPCWRKLDQIKEAKSLAAPIYNSRVRAILEQIYLIKRLQTMSEFFNICMEMCQAYKSRNKYVAFNDEQLIKPIRKFIADYISKQFLGITTEAIAYTICFLLQHLGLDITNEIEQKDIGAENKVPLDELYHKGWSLFLKRGTFSQNILAQASSLETNLKTAWEKMQEPKKLEQNLALLKSSLIRIQHQITTFNWMFTNEDVLNQHSWMQNGHTMGRSKFILDLQHESSALSAIQSKLADTQELQKPLISSVAQRLKWAAGANPDLSKVLTAFESAVFTLEKKLDSEQQIADIVLTTCNTILQHELLRKSSTESKLFDQKFLSGCDKWRMACQFGTMKLDTVSSVEENIMQLYTSEMDNNPRWLSLISENISDTISGTQNELEDLKAAKETIIEATFVNVINLQHHYTHHCKLMADFKTLIKSISKIEEYAPKAQQFIVDYRKYIDNFTSFLHKVKKDIVRDDVVESLKNLHYLCENSTLIYDNLMKLMDKEDELSTRQPSSTRQEHAELLTIKQESKARGQQRNAYAVGVWRRVRQKLEGRDPDPGRKYTTQEQVDYVIREATSLDNLALLYEGWTPWV